MADNNNDENENEEPVDEWEALENEVMDRSESAFGGDLDGEGGDGLGGFGGGDLEDEVMSRTENTLGGDMDTSLSDVFGGGSLKDSLSEIDELDDDDAEAIVEAGYDSPGELVDAGVHELMEVPGIGVQKGAAVVEWAETRVNDDGEGAVSGDNPGGSVATTAAQLLESAGSGEKQSETADSDDSERAEELGKTAGSVLLFPFRVVLSFLGGLAFTLSKFVPYRSKIYKKMIKLGYRGIYKKMGAHVVANTIYGDGEMVPRKAELDKETGHLETSNGEWWTASSGLQPVYINDVPVVFGVADQHELVDPVGARIAEAVDLGPQRYQRVDQTERGYEPVTAGQSGAQATAATDGGNSLPCTFDDVWLDVSNPVESNDGMVVSLEKAYEMHWDQGSSEEMEQQETRGMLAVMDPRNSRKKALIYVILFAAGILLGMFGPGLASQVAGDAADTATGVSLSLGVW